MDKTHRTRRESNHPADQPQKAPVSHRPSCRHADADGVCLCREWAMFEPHLSRTRPRSASSDRYAQFRGSPVAATLVWVASAGELADPPLLWDRRIPAESLPMGSACYLVALDLIHNKRTARWWPARAPKPSVFDWKLLQGRVRYKQRRAARHDAGVGVSLDAPDHRCPDESEGGTATLHETLAHPKPLMRQRQIEARLELEALAARAHLYPREAEVIAEVLKLGGLEHGVLTDVASEMGLDPGAVRRYWHDAQAKLLAASP